MLRASADGLAVYDPAAAANSRAREPGRWRDVLEERRFLAAAPDRARRPVHRPARRRAAPARDLPEPDRRNGRLAERRLRRAAQLHRGLGQPDLPPRAAQHDHLHGRLAGDRAAGRGLLAHALAEAFRGSWFLRFLILLPWAAPIALEHDRLPLDLPLALQRRELDARQRRLPGRRSSSSRTRS